MHFPRPSPTLRLRRTPCAAATLLAALALATAVLEVAGYEDPAKFLLVSNAAAGSISYGKLSDKGKVDKLHKLIEAKNGLIHPQGLAIDQKRHLLLVADSGIRKVVSYGLSVDGDSLSVDEQTSVAEDVEARWVTVDGLGNVYFSDESNSRIMKVPAQAVSDGNTTSEVEFNQKYVTALSAPGGLATDNYFLYWTNKLDGNEKGTVVRALKDERVGIDELEIKVLTKSSPKAYGVCLAIDQIFYTEDDEQLWAAPKSGGQAVVVSKTMRSPRGCVWDAIAGGKVFVADRSAGGVYSLSAPMLSLTETDATKVADVEDAFGVAVFSAAWRRSFMPMLFALLVLLCHCFA